MIGSHSADRDDLLSVRSARLPIALPDSVAQIQPSVCRVLLVCQSAFFRHVLTGLLAGDARFEVVGNVRSGSDVLSVLDKVRAHTLLFDEDISETERKSTLRRMNERHAQVGAVCCLPLEERCSVVRVGSDATPYRADDGAIAADAVRPDRVEFANELRNKLMRACGFVASNPPAPTALRANRSTARSTAGAETTPGWQQSRDLAPALHGPRALAIGCSTGGPSALTNLLPSLPADFPLPVLIVQHMPPDFTKQLAERLARVSRIPVMEAEDGMEVRPGVALLAPGDFHMHLVRRRHHIEVRLTQDELENSCRPAVDVLFRSAAEIYRGGVIATVLTGMGQDGLKGVRVLKERGAPVFVQDRETSVVWGMPGAIAGAGLADSILPLEQIAPAILRLL